MKKYLIPLLVLGILVAAALTCPDRQAHKNAVNDVVKEVVQEKVSGYVGAGVGSIVTGIVSPATDWILDQTLTVRNFYVLSIGQFKTREGAKTVSVGVFGHVFTFSKEDLQDALKDYSGEVLKQFALDFIKAQLFQGL